VNMIRIFAAAVILAMTAPSLAHHSFSADYDSSKVVKLTGNVSKVDWRNPHAFFYIDSKKGNHAIELGSLDSLARLGWTPRTLKIGDEVTVEGILALGGRRMILAREVVLTRTGERLNTWEGVSFRTLDTPPTAPVH
jgi:hypothetical protein